MSFQAFVLLGGEITALYRSRLCVCNKFGDGRLRELDRSIFGVQVGGRIVGHTLYCLNWPSIPHRFSSSFSVERDVGRVKNKDTV